MINSKCCQFLSLFSKKDLKRFEDFVQSPFFNKDEAVIRLYKWLKVFFEEPAKRTITYHTAYQRTFPNKLAPGQPLANKSMQELHVVLSKLSKLVIHYIQWKKMEEHEAYGQHVVLKELLEKRADKLFESYSNRVFKNKNKSGRINTETYHDNFLLTYDYFRWIILQKHRFQKNDNLQTVSDNLTHYYLITQLSLACTMLNISYVYKKSYNLNFLKHVLDMAALPQYCEEPLTKIYVIALQLVKEEKAVDFEALKQLLDIYKNDVPQKVQNDMYQLATNFCINRIIAGESEYLEELFQLYKMMSEKNLLIKGKYIPIDDMKNIISVGCKLKHFKWTEQLIEENKERIAPNFSNSVYHFGIGVIHFYRNDLKGAIRHLIRVEDISTNYTIDGKFVMMKAYYELDEDFSERTERIFLSFIAYIKQNRIISAFNKKGYRNFTKTLHSLYRIKHNVGKQTIEHIENRLNTYTETSDKKWLLEKIEELKKGA